MSKLEGVVKGEFAFHGIRVQLKAGQIWEANEVRKQMEDLQKTKAVLVISIIPDNNWWGFTKDNDRQVKAIAQVSISNLTM